MEAGRIHLARARELVPGPWGPGSPLGFLEVEGPWACGQLREALASAAKLMADLAPIDSGGADELMAVAARVAGGSRRTAGQARRGNGPPGTTSISLRGPAPFAPAAPADLFHPALGRLYAADRGRCRGGSETAALWTSAVAACAEAGLVWDEALASYHLARSLLTARRLPQ